MSYRKLLYGALAIVFAVSLVPYQAKAAPSTPPRGWLDSCSHGWALDVNTPEQSIDVHIYVDKPAGVDNNSGFVAVVPTGVVRDDVNGVYHRPLGERHGFEWSPPKSLYDGRAHTVYAYGIDSTDTSGASNAMLDGSPQTCTWPGGTDVSRGITVTSPTAGEQWQVGTLHNITWTDIRGTAVGGKYTVQLEPYIACLHGTTRTCSIAQPAPYTIVEHLADDGFAWNIPTTLPSMYRGANRILVVLDNSDVHGYSGVFNVVETGASLSIAVGTAIPTGSVGQFFDLFFNVSGGTSPYTVGIDGTLPSGVELKYVVPSCAPPAEGLANCPLGEYHLSGTPTQAGSFPVTAFVTDSAGHKASTNFVLTITPASTGGLTITGPTSLSATVGLPFTASFTVSGGTAPYQWQQVGGAMPDGINITFPAFNCITTPCVNPYDTAIFKGTPTQVGSPTATFRVTDAAGRTVEKAFTFVVTSVSSNMVVSSPAAGAVWQAGHTYPITWVSEQSSGTTAKIELEQYIGCLYDTVTPCALAQPRPYTIATAAPNIGSYSWTIPLDLPYLSARVFRIIVTISSGRSGTSGVFNIGQEKRVQAGYVDVATGQRVEGWAFDSSKPGACVTLTYKRNTTGSDNNRFTQDVCPTLTRTDAAEWIRKNFGDGYVVTQPLGFRADPTQVLPPGTYLVAGAKLKDSGVAIDLGESAKFPITIADDTTAKGPIVITSPAKGDAWQTGQTKVIAWSGNNNLPVNIKLVGQGCPATQICPAVLPRQYDIASGVTGTTYSYVIPTAIAPGAYRISMETSASGVDYILWGQSGVFTITSGGVSTSSLQVTSPTAGETVYAGEVKNIVWNVLAGTQDLPVTIKYSYTVHPACRDAVPPCGVPDTLEVVTITTTAPNTGSYAWSVPAKLGGKYTILVSMGVYSAESGQFSIMSRRDPESIVVKVPAKDEVWSRGETHTIYWNPNVANTKVSVSVTRYIACLHSDTYICAVAQPAPVVIEPSAPDTGSFEWDIPKDFNLTGPVTITIANAVTGKTGESGPFQISDGTTVGPCVTIKPGQVVVGTSGTVYVITPECKKYGFISLQDFTSRGYNFNQVVKVDQAALDAIPTVEFLARPANTSFKYANAPAVYYLTTAQCKEVYPSLTTLRAWGVSAGSIVTIPVTEQYPDCNPHFVQLPNNTWAQVSAEPTIYHVEGTVMRPYASLGALIASGFQNAKLYIIRQAEFNLYTVGDSIQ